MTEAQYDSDKIWYCVHCRAMVATFFRKDRDNFNVPCCKECKKVNWEQWATLAQRGTGWPVRRRNE